MADNTIEFDFGRPQGTEERYISTAESKIKDGGYYVSRRDHEDLQGRYSDMRTAMQLLGIMFVVVVLYAAAMTRGYANLDSKIKNHKCTYDVRTK